MTRKQLLPERILAQARRHPEGTILTAKELLHLGNRAAVAQALTRLVAQGELQRAARGMYVLPVKTPYGTLLPAPVKVIQSMAAHRGEAVARQGAAAANLLGLTTQVPLKEIYLTTGRTERLSFGKQVVELRHAPKWQLMFPGEPAGEAIRSLAWLGPKRAEEAMTHLAKVLRPKEVKRLMSARAEMPSWMAQEISALSRHA
jgi:Family of unknown function (DUF6088)